MCANGCSDFTVKCQIGWVNRERPEGTYDTNNAVAWAKVRMTGEVFPICHHHILHSPLHFWVRTWELLPIPGKALPEDVAELSRWAARARERETR